MFGKSHSTRPNSKALQQAGERTGPRRFGNKIIPSTSE
jgi:hypothetical protein